MQAGMRRRLRVGVLCLLMLLCSTVFDSVSAAKGQGIALAWSTGFMHIPTQSQPTPLARPSGAARRDPTVSPPQSPPAAPSEMGQVIVVSEAAQWLWVFQDRRLVYATPVTTGRPTLATPRGTFHVLSKSRDIVFRSAWPQGSPYYYTPEHVTYALYFRATGFYIHDAPWRTSFGPGSEVPHTNPDGSRETGSHGCVNVPTAAGAWLYAHIAVGATIAID